jgi:hypothetical protein
MSFNYYTYQEKPSKKQQKNHVNMPTSIIIRLYYVKSRHYYILTISLIALIVILLSSNELLTNEIRAFLYRVPKVDTIGHFISFFLLTWLVVVIIRIPMTISVITIILYGAITEVGQYYLGFRSGEFADFLADIVGVTIFIVLKLIYDLLLSLKKIKLL